MYSFKNLKIITICTGLAIVTGCSSIDSKPFEKFSESLTELDKGATASLNVTIPMTESRFRNQLVSNLRAGKSDVHKLLTVQIDPSTNKDPFYISPGPLFIETERFKQGIDKSNQVWVDYAKLLVMLSSEELSNPNDFEAMSTDLNAHSMNAIRALNDDPSKVSAKNSAIFSTIAITAAKAFIDDKQKDTLAKAITGNQTAIERYADQMKSSIITIAQYSTQEFTEVQQVESRKLLTLIKGKDAAKTQKSVSKLIDNKQQHAQQMRSLNALYIAYSKIPEAHKSLSNSLSNGETSLVAINSLLEKGVAMHTSYKTKLAHNKAELIQAKADAADAVASAGELKYQQAVLVYSLAQLDYTEALTESSNSPNDQGKKDHANKLKEQAEKLKVEANKLGEQAGALRIAATSVQDSANNIKNTITGK